MDLITARALLDLLVDAGWMSRSDAGGFDRRLTPLADDEQVAVLQPLLIDEGHVSPAQHSSSSRADAASCGCPWCNRRAARGAS